MLIERTVYALLAASAELTALVPVSRIKPPGNWQDLPRPWVEHRLVSQEPLYTHDGRAALTNYPYQVSVFADDYQEARDIALVVRTALISPGFIYTGQQELEDREQGIFQTVLQFDVWDSQ